MLKSIALLTFFISNLISNINSQCGTSFVDNPVNTTTDCTQKSTANSYCCMISSPGYSPTNKTCLQIEAPLYVGQTKYSYNNLIWNFDCGSAVANETTGGKCGNDNPVFAADCWSFSKRYDSCCYYLSNNSTGAPGCQWLGDKVSGNVTVAPLYRYLMACSSEKTVINYILILLSTIFLIFF